MCSKVDCVIDCSKMWIISRRCEWNCYIFQSLSPLCLTELNNNNNTIFKHQFHSRRVYPVFIGVACQGLRAGNWGYKSLMSLWAEIHAVFTLALYLVVFNLWLAYPIVPLKIIFDCHSFCLCMFLFFSAVLHAHVHCLHYDFCTINSLLSIE